MEMNAVQEELAQKNKSDIAELNKQWTNKYNEIESEKNELYKENAKLVEDLTKMKYKLNNLNEEIVERKNKLQQQNELPKLLDKKDDKIKELEEIIHDNNNLISRLEIKLKSVETERDRLKIDVDSSNFASNKVRNIKNEIDQLKCQLYDSERKAKYFEKKFLSERKTNERNQHDFVHSISPPLYVEDVRLYKPHFSPKPRTFIITPRLYPDNIYPNS